MGDLHSDYGHEVHHADMQSDYPLVVLPPGHLERYCGFERQDSNCGGKSISGWRHAMSGRAYS